MGNKLTKETDEEIEIWKSEAAQILKRYYLAFGGQNWDEYSGEDQLPLLRTKICYAIFGSPTQASEHIQDAYSKQQTDQGDKIAKKIWETHKKSPRTDSPLLVSILLVACKSGTNKFLTPVFSVFTETYSPDESTSEYGKERKYVDPQCRVYDSWFDWKNSNRLPAVRYAYPANGYFSCEARRFGFDVEKDPVLEYGTSPACGSGQTFIRRADVGIAAASLGAGGIAFASMFTPVGPAVLLGCEVVGYTSAAYGFGRSIHRLIDKRKHGESLKDLESIVLWGNIAATSIHAASRLANYKLKIEAQQGHTFSSIQCALTTALNYTRFGAEGIMLCVGLANLYSKKRDNQLTKLDVLQFSISLFFFTHTLYEPKTAEAIIEKAQSEYIGGYGLRMTVANAKKNFFDFLKSNQETKPIADIIRKLNLIDDPDAYFNQKTSGVFWTRMATFVANSYGLCKEIICSNLPNVTGTPNVNAGQAFVAPVDIANQIHVHLPEQHANGVLGAGPLAALSAAGIEAATTALINVITDEIQKAALPSNATNQREEETEPQSYPEHQALLSIAAP